MTIAQSDDTYCHATNQRSDGLPAIQLEERETRISFNSLTLLPGIFFIHAAIFEPMKHTHCNFWKCGHV